VVAVTCRVRRVILDDPRPDDFAVEYDCDVTVSVRQGHVAGDTAQLLRAYRGPESSPTDLAAHLDWALLGAIYAARDPANSHRVLAALQSAQESGAPAGWFLTYEESQRP
jgi:hypothetical protein